MATAISRRDRIISMGLAKMEFICLFKAKFLSNLNRRWPATMLADNRIDKVMGRMMFLVSSISTMKFIRASGVPVGTV